MTIQKDIPFSDYTAVYFPQFIHNKPADHNCHIILDGVGENIVKLYNPI